MSQKIIITIYFSLIIAASILFSSLYIQAWDPTWNPFRPDPSVVITEMGIELAKVKTFHSDVDFEIGIKKEQEFNINGNIKAEADITNPENVKSAIEFKFFFAAEGMELSLDGESKTIDDTNYFKLTSIPAFPALEPFLAMLGMDLEDFKNQWIKIDQESLEKIAGEEYQPPEEEEKMEEFIVGIKEVLEKVKMFKVKEELADEEINGQKAYHYMVVLDLDDFFEKTGEIGEIPAEIWIGKKDKLPYRIKLKKEIDISKFDETQDGLIDIKLNIEMSDFNQTANIEAPQNFKTIDELLTNYQ